MSNVSYHISIKSAGAYFSPKRTEATAPLIKIQVLGVGETGWHLLTNFDKKDYSKGRIDVFIIEDRDVGKPIVVKIKLEKWDNSKHEWLCDWIKVTKDDGVETLFPVYDFLQCDQQFCHGEASLPHRMEDGVLTSARNKEIQSNKQMYKFLSRQAQTNAAEYTGLPRLTDAAKYDDLPKGFQKYRIRATEPSGPTVTEIISLFKRGVKVQSIKSLDDFHLVSAAMPPPKTNYLTDWDKDDVQGWQILNGPHPLSFAACTKIPPYFLVNDSDLSKLLEGRTIQEEIHAGKLFISDFSEVYGPNSELVHIEGTYCPPVVALFHVNGANKFVPIAIQLQPSDRNYLYVADGSQAWLLAKMYLRCCMSNIHEWIYHFLHTHKAMEPFAVALFRCLPKSHPVYKLLRPHVRSLVMVNLDAQIHLTPSDSIVASGIGISLNPSNIPEYWYGRDILAIWNIVHEYVAEILGIYYTKGDEMFDQDVRKDSELQEWASECSNEGFAWEDGHTRGVPNQFTSLHQLIEHCTILIVTCTAQHAAVNYGQYENYRFPPNSPFLMNLPPHKKSEEINLQRILKTLPSLEQAKTIVSLVLSLSFFTELEIYIGQFPEQWFVEKTALGAQARFKGKIEKLRAVIEERNSHGGRLYNDLNPTHIPNSVTI